MRQTERAIFDLRSGHPVLLREGGQATLIQAVEGLGPEGLGALQAYAEGTGLKVVLTKHRLAAMLPELLLPSNPVVVSLLAGTCAEQLLDLATGPAPELSHQVTPDSLAAPTKAERAAMMLARRGHLLPAMIAVPLAGALPAAIEDEVADGTLLALDAERALANASASRVTLERISEAAVPLVGSEKTRFILFREGPGMREHVALMIGDPEQWPKPVPVRLHSACLTGDLFGSLRCDCGEQLRSGVETIAECGGGLLLYLAQEGRDIGLANKLRAYTLQDTGLDTIDADQMLGFSDDERHYDVAVAMLQALDIEQIALLTNNPAKINAIRRGGIEVANRQALHGRVNVHNRRYLSAKASRSGHLLGELLNPGSSQP